MTYDAVIFDLFGTLVHNFSTAYYDRILAEMARVMDLPADAFTHQWKVFMPDRMAGRLGGMDGNVTAVCSALGADPAPDKIAEAVEIRVDFTRRSLELKHDAVSTLTELKIKGCKLGLISDCTAEVPALWTDTPFADLIDEPIFSCVEGITKPSLAIYRLAYNRLRVEPESCIYVGDGTSRELQGAKEAGMLAVLIRGPEFNLANHDRTEAQSWPGPAISDLSEVIPLVG